MVRAVAIKLNDDDIEKYKQKWGRYSMTDTELLRAALDSKPGLLRRGSDEDLTRVRTERNQARSDLELSRARATRLTNQLTELTVVNQGLTLKLTNLKEDNEKVVAANTGPTTQPPVGPGPLRSIPERVVERGPPPGPRGPEPPSRRVWERAYKDLMREWTDLGGAPVFKVPRFRKDGPALKWYRGHARSLHKNVVKAGGRGLPPELLNEPSTGGQP